MDQLERHAGAEHWAMAREASAEHFFRANGWIHLHRSKASFAAAESELHYARIFGAGYDILEPGQVAELEPHVRPVFHKAIHWKDSESVSSPGGVTKAYAEAFARNGGQILRGDALSLRREGDSWGVETQSGSLTGTDVVVALGPWSMDLLKLFGYDLPLAVKRGYHTHYRTMGNATLSRPVVDIDNGFVLTPMERGIRLTTGIEFAARDAVATPVQIRRTKPLARQLFPLDSEVDLAPWMGARPCFPDSLPMVGRSPRHTGLWFSFGHAHTGFTNGPVTGRLLSEMMTGARTLVDPKPYSPTRFIEI
jgi:D-lysine oxidase